MMIRAVSPLWRAAIDEYLSSQRSGGASKNTVNVRRQHLENLARGIGEDDPWKVKRGRLIDWCADRPWSRETRRSRRTTFRSFWAWANLHGKTKKNPAAHLPSIKPARPVPRPTPQAAIKHAMAGADPRLKLMLRLALECGLRRLEVATLHTDDVIEDLLGYSLHIVGKGDHERVVPCPPGLAQHLLARDRGYIFPGDDNGHLSPRYVGKLVAAALPDRWTMHSLRHRAGTDWYSMDRDMFTVQDLLGHASPVTTRVYVEIPKDRLRETVLAVAASRV